MHNCKCKENTNETLGTIVRVFITGELGIYLDVLTMTLVKKKRSSHRIGASHHPHVWPEVWPEVVLSLTGSRASTTLDSLSLSRDPAAYVVPDDGPVVMETVLPRVHRTRQTGLERLWRHHVEATFHVAPRKWLALSLDVEYKYRDKSPAKKHTFTCETSLWLWEQLVSLCCSPSSTTQDVSMQFPIWTAS